MTTRCNDSHCAWRGADARILYAPLDPLAWRRNGVRELQTKVALADDGKGRGVFARQRAGPGRWVCSYAGTYFGPRALLRRYQAGDVPVYAYRLGLGAIDARDSSHFSAMINHNEKANLHAIVSVAAKRIDFYAKRPLSVGTELTIDYGTGYWRSRTQRPAGGTESRPIALRGKRRWRPPHLWGRPVSRANHTSFAHPHSSGGRGIDLDAQLQVMA